ncbi:AraC family transcriptional regulator [Pelomonas sp. CA6]|uniref:helix-turn-helix transcriptional regulator n=1 Tax=Pelomonas sp. CA6 TaxID=2907999 RepID=UPI001F4B8F9F|nr:AraC family transcriptional regulator [Pelomonas sp. CA6]MCH7341879.1 AraC family transcriptional regulator [Pelomonas sp. CA6]
MFEVTTPTPPSAPARHFARRLRPGLVLRCSASRHAHDAAQEVEASAGLYLVVALRGRVHVAFGERHERLGDAEAQDLALVTLRHGDRFRRLDVDDGAEECKLSLHAGPDWLEQAELLPGPPRPHLAGAHGRAGARLRRLARSVIDSGGPSRGLERLQLECLTLQLLGEALSEQAGAEPPASMARRMAQARELLDSGAADAWSLADIALELGLHENTLQRRFREAHGCSVFDYLRRRRLERARALLQAGASVTEAALDAGYGSPANFATAFRRAFGCSPSQQRPR